MILEAKAKPVKFRIRSGGEEHSSLESLRGNFVWEDIKPLCGSGKQLEKWLERIDVNVATCYGKIESPADNFLAVYNVIFKNKESALITNEDVFQEYESLIGDNDLTKGSKVSELRCLKVLCSEIISELPLKQLKINIGKYKSLEELFEQELVIKVRKADSKMNPQELFACGKILFDSPVNNGLAKEWIRTASTMGLKKASDFIDEHFYEDRISVRERLLSSLATEKIKKQIQKSWIDEERIGNLNDFGKGEQNLLSLSNTCLDVFLRCKKDGDISDGYKKEMYQIAENAFKSFSQDDPLYEEKMFVMALIDYDNDRALRRLKNIDCYPPAKYLLNDGTHSFVAEDRRYRIGYIYSNTQKLGFLILNLERFGQEKEFQKMLSFNYGEGYNSHQNELERLFSEKSVTDRITKSWESKKYIMPINSFELKNKLFDLSDKCLRIFNLVQDGNIIGDIELEKKVNTIMGDMLLMASDTLYIEKVFVMGLFAKNFDLARQKMKKIEYYYYPAFHLANDEMHCMTIEKHTYSISDGWRRRNADGLEFFIKNLPIFRKYVKSDK